MSARLRTAAGLSIVSVIGAVPVLLRRMRAEFEQRRRLSGPTATAMYATYGVHAAAIAAASWRRSVPLPARTAPARTALTATGVTGLLAGSALTAAGMSRFTGPAQVTGTSADGLAQDGVYRISRNPQYTGYVLALTGLGLVRRSGAVLGLTAAVAAVFAWWVPVEERALSQTYGQPYGAYLRDTARWLALPSRR